MTSSRPFLLEIHTSSDQIGTILEPLEPVSSCHFGWNLGVLLFVEVCGKVPAAKAHP